jgi:hypothetical protein
MAIELATSRQVGDVPLAPFQDAGAASALGMEKQKATLRVVRAHASLNKPALTSFDKAPA